jgi:hypothetical protein
MRRALLAVLLAGIALPAHAGGITLAMDEVQTVTFPKAVATVNVGNPAIADITMIDSRHAFVLGKSYGSTNIIAVNQNGDAISNTRVAVLGGGQATVTLQRGTERTTYNCTANHCEVSPQPGDGKIADAILGQITNHQDAARKAAMPAQ